MIFFCAILKLPISKKASALPINQSTNQLKTLVNKNKKSLRNTTGQNNQGSMSIFATL